MNAQLGVDAAEVSLDRFRADERPVGYLQVGEAGCGQPGDLLLGGSQPLGGAPERAAAAPSRSPLAAGRSPWQRARFQLMQLAAVASARDRRWHEGCRR